MNSFAPEIITFKEYTAQLFPRERIPGDLGEILYDKYRTQLQVDFPSHPTGNQWRITPLGWIGYIPLSPGLHFAIEPKAGLSNLFRMLDYAYKLDIHLQAELFQCVSLQDFYDQLASILGKRILDRGRKGFHRTYVAYQDHLPYLRERVNLNSWIRSPWKVNLDCEFHDHTIDIEDNQILAWTLFVIGRSGLCSNKTLGIIRNAYHELDGYVSLQSFNPSSCINRLYHRLNEDYHPLHALCRFFLEQSGPSHHIGDRTMVPFLINMSRLFELFVSEWLLKNLPSGLRINDQEKVGISADNHLYFQVDLVLRDNRTDSVMCVLDTKYKLTETPSSDDIAQVIAYADTLGCQEAVLIYPSKQTYPIDIKPGRVRVRSITFNLAGDLEEAGKEFLQSILMPQET